jgi:hypothetical protein
MGEFLRSNLPLWGRWQREALTEAERAALRQPPPTRPLARPAHLPQRGSV